MLGRLDLEASDGPAAVATPIVAGANPLSGTPVAFVSAAQIDGAFDRYARGETSDGRSTSITRVGNTFAVDLLNGPATTLPTPQVASMSFDTLARQALVIGFNTDVSAFLSRSDLVIENATSQQVFHLGALAYDPGTHQATVLLTNQIPDGNYRLSLRHADVANGSGTALLSVSPLEFFVLAGDVNRDRAVDFDDLLVMAQNYASTSATLAQGDVNYDGAVNFDDLLVLAQNYNQSLLAMPVEKKAYRRPPAR